MKVPFFDLKRIYLEQKTEIDNAVMAALGSGHYILGDLGERFEREMKKFLGAPESGAFLGCNSGTDALILSLLGVEVGPGDEVLTPSFTAIPTITAIRTAGAIPVFVDIDAETWLMDRADAMKKITSKTKAVIAVHLYGNVVDVAALSEELKKKGRSDIAVIEDVAQATGATLHGRAAGTWGRFGAFSFYPTKNLGAFGDGGGVFCSSTSDGERVRMLRNYGQRDRYHSEVPRGLNSRLDELQAAILMAQLPRVSGWLEKKAAMMDRYRTELSGLPLRFQKVTPGCEPAWHLCVIELEDSGVRERFQADLSKKGIQTLIHYPYPNHLQKAFASSSPEKLSRTEELTARIVSIPMNAVLTGQEQNEVIAAIRDFFNF